MEEEEEEAGTERVEGVVVADVVGKRGIVVGAIRRGEPREQEEEEEEEEEEKEEEGDNQDEPADTDSGTDASGDSDEDGATTAEAEV